MSFEIEIKGLDKLKDGMKKSPKIVYNRLSNAIKTSVHLIRPIMRGEAPRGQTKRLNRNIYAIARGLFGAVGPNLHITPYAWFVHEGTKAHTILPKTKKALYWKGALHPVRKVRHPGTTANPFVDRTFSQIKRPVEEIFEKAIEKITQDIVKK